MSLNCRLAKLEAKWPAPPAASDAGLDLPPKGDFLALDKWLATHIPRMIEGWLCGPGWCLGSINEDRLPDPKGPFGGVEGFRAAWGAYRHLTWKIDCDVFDFWYPNRDDELYGAKKRLIAVMKPALAACDRPFAHYVSTLLPREDGEAASWAPIYPPTVYGPTMHDRWPEHLAANMADCRRVGFRRRFLERCAAAGDEEAIADLAQLVAAVAEREAAAKSPQGGPICSGRYPV
jgi:hypothetical protein